MKQPSERQEQQKKHQLVTPKAIPKHEEFMNRPNCNDPIFSHKQMKQTNSLNHPASDFPWKPKKTGGPDSRFPLD